MNSTELMQELLKNVSNSKQNGTFDFDQLAQSIQQILPYLSSEQQNSILTILNRLK